MPWFWGPSASEIRDFLASQEPIVLMGRGHSGTRVLAYAVQALGVNLGFTDRMASGDPEDKTFRRGLAKLSRRWDVGDVPPERELRPFCKLVYRWHRQLQPTGPWGWKYPETYLMAPHVHAVFPRARYLHIIRDGRDVVCSLLEKPWLRRAQTSEDDAGLPYGSYARFWVEEDRREEFESATDARRAAWVWRSYVTAARRVSGPVEIRYEELTADPAGVAVVLAPRLGVDDRRLATALGRAHAGSVGRYATDLDAAQLADVEDEAAALLRELGYVSSASA